MSMDFDPRADYYKVLGLANGATADEIKKAYRKLAKQFHPDSTGGDKKKEARFKEVNTAYEVLSDPEKRAQYDEIRSGGFRTGVAGRQGFAGTAGEGVDFGQLFSQFFSGVRPPAAGQATVDPFDAHEQFRGGPTANYGRGAAKAYSARDATDADFESKIRASDGSWLTVVGSDVNSDVRISFDRAILGTVADVATIDGKAQVKIPPGTSSGKRLRLRGKGVAGATGPGDHYVTVHIDVPGDLDDAAKHALVDLMAKLKKSARKG